jgi:RNase H-fold protein (predicted Holliday junction resolvase)
MMMHKTTRPILQPVLIGLLLTTTVITGVPQFARAQNDQVAVSTALAGMKNYTPATTKVVILPVIDKSGEKDDQRRDQANAVKMEAYDQFFQRGFQVIDEATVTKAVTGSGINFDDQEEHRKDNLYKLGKALNADLVLFVVVDQAYSKIKKNVFNEQREGLAKTRTWLIDAKDQKPLLSAFIREGKSTGNSGIGSKGNRSHMGAACSNAIRDTLNSVLTPFDRDKKKHWPGNKTKD